MNVRANQIIAEVGFVESLIAKTGAAIQSVYSTEAGKVIITTKKGDTIEVQVEKHPRGTGYYVVGSALKA